MTNLPPLNLLLQNSKLCVRISTFESLTSSFKNPQKMASLTKLSLAAALLLSTLCPLPLHSQSTRQYQEYPDTLVLTTHLEKGVGLFSPGAGRMQFRDTSEFKKFDFFPAKEIR